VGVAVDAHQHPLAADPLTVGLGEVEAPGLGVELQEAAAFGRVAHQPLRSHRVARPFVEQTPAGVGGQGEAGAIHGAQDAFGLARRA